MKNRGKKSTHQTDLDIYKKKKKMLSVIYYLFLSPHPLNLIKLNFRFTRRKAANSFIYRQQKSEV